MTDNEIPAGTRAVMFTFTTDRGTPRVTFDLLDVRWSRKTLSELTSLALTGVIEQTARYGGVSDYKVHFVN